jgi:hypothetical protein
VGAYNQLGRRELAPEIISLVAGGGPDRDTQVVAPRCAIADLDQSEEDLILPYRTA